MQVIQEENLLIVTENTEVPEIEGQRGWGDVRQRLSTVAEIRVTVLEQNMNRFLQVMGHLFQQADQHVESQSSLCLNEVELQVEISAKGEVKLFAGGEAASKGMITLKFKRLNQH